MASSSSSSTIGGIGGGSGIGIGGSGSGSSQESNNLVSITHLIFTLEQTEYKSTQTDTQQQQLEDLKAHYKMDVSRGSPGIADSQFNYGKALIKSQRLVDNFLGVQLLSRLPTDYLYSSSSSSLPTTTTTTTMSTTASSTGDNCYYFALGYYRLASFAKAHLWVSRALEKDPHHHRASLLQQILTHFLREAKMRKVLVFIDGESAGVQAFLTTVQRVAHRETDVVVLLAVFDSPESLVDTTIEGWESLLQDRLDDILETRLQEYIAVLKEVKIDYSIAHGFGSPKEVIGQKVSELGIDIAVVGENVEANILFKLTGTTVADHCVAHLPCQVVVAKDVLGAQRAQIISNLELSKLLPANIVDSRPPPPRRNHTQEASPSEEVPLAEQVKQSFTSFVDYLGTQATTFQNAAASALSSSPPSSSSSSSSSPILTPPPEPAPPPPSSEESTASNTGEARKSWDPRNYLQQFGQQLPFLAPKKN